MKRIAIIGNSSVGIAIHRALYAQQISAHIIVVDSIEEAQKMLGERPFDPEPIPFKAPPPTPKIGYFDPTSEGKRPRAMRREAERKKKRKR